MTLKDSIYSESTIYTIKKAIFTPSLRSAGAKCVPSIIFNFFLRQYHAAFLPGRIPVSKVDHPLDEKIPFVPAWMTIYFDFVQFWIRMLAFFIRRYGRRAYTPVRDFILSMGKLYAFAAEVYTKNLSTTKRPFYIARPRFFLIHLLDPHLMCIPSLHVMIVIHAYTQFAAIAEKLGEQENLKEQIEEMRQGALAISQAILFVKQHSVNCIPAAMYAMTCFSPEHFTEKEAQVFTNLLFSPAPSAEEAIRKIRVHPSAAPVIGIPKEDLVMIKEHIMSLYRSFCSERQEGDWYKPLIRFLREYKSGDE